MARPDPWPKSIFARNLTEEAGITELMDDLGEALTLGRGKIRMMGGGNPARIPEMEAVWRERMRELLEEPSGEFDRVLAEKPRPCVTRRTSWPCWMTKGAISMSLRSGWPPPSALRSVLPMACSRSVRMPVGIAVRSPRCSAMSSLVSGWPELSGRAVTT